MKILITSTSFQDTPGKHKELIENTGFEIDTLRGPLTKDVLLPIIHEYDGVICGDDEYTSEVLDQGKKGRLKVLSKYGIGLDKVDLGRAKKNGISVFNTPGVNSEAVSEHVFALLLSFEKNIIEENRIVQDNKWDRLIGRELFGKKILVFGLGSVGKEVAKRAKAFGMIVYGYDISEDKDFIKSSQVSFTNNFKEILPEMDYISLNAPLNDKTRHIINKEVFDLCKKDLVLINTARAELIDMKIIIEYLNSDKIRGYLTDVLEEEPIIKNHPFLNCKNVLITPHIGSRNHETVQRQGLKSVENLINFFKNYNK